MASPPPHAQAQPLSLPLLHPPHSLSLRSALQAYQTHLTLHLFPPSSPFHELVSVLIPYLATVYGPTWDENDPEKGSGGRAIKQWKGRGVDPKFAAALKQCRRIRDGDEERDALRVAFEKVYGPIWTVWIDPGCVSLRCVKVQRDYLVVEIWGTLWNEGMGRETSAGLRRQWGVSRARVWKSVNLVKAPEGIKCDLEEEEDPLEDFLVEDYTNVPSTQPNLLFQIAAPSPSTNTNASSSITLPRGLFPVPSGLTAPSPVHLHGTGTFTPSPSRAHAIPIISPLSSLAVSSSPIPNSDASIAGQDASGNGGHSNSSSISSSTFGIGLAGTGTAASVNTTTTESTSRPESVGSDWSASEGKRGGREGSTESEWSVVSAPDGAEKEKEKEIVVLVEDKDSESGEPTPSLALVQDIVNAKISSRPCTPPAPVFSASRALQDAISPNFKFPSNAPSVPSTPSKSGNATILKGKEDKAPVTLTLTAPTPLKPSHSSSTIVPDGWRERSRERSTGGLMAPPMLAPLNTSPGGGAHGNGNGTRKKERRHGHSPTGSLGGAAPPPFILSPSPRAFDPNAKPSTPSTPGHSRNASATSSNHTPSRPHSAASTAGDVTEYSGGKVGVLGGGVKLGTPTTPNSGGIGGRDHHPNGSVGRNGGHGHGHRRAQSSQTGRSGGFHYPSGVMMNTPW